MFPNVRFAKPVVALPPLAPQEKPERKRKRDIVVVGPSDDVVCTGENIRPERTGPEPTLVDLTSPKGETESKKEQESDTPFEERPLKRRLRPRKKPEAVAAEPQTPSNVRKTTKTTPKKRTTPTKTPTKKVSPGKKAAEPKKITPVPAQINKARTSQQGRQNAGQPIEIADSEEDDASL